MEFLVHQKVFPWINQVLCGTKMVKRLACTQLTLTCVSTVCKKEKHKKNKKEIPVIMKPWPLLEPGKHIFSLAYSSLVPNISMNSLSLKTKLCAPFFPPHTYTH